MCARCPLHSGLKKRCASCAGIRQTRTFREQLRRSGAGHQPSTEHPFVPIVAPSRNAEERRPKSIIVWIA
jgi:hypothetical protein